MYNFNHTDWRRTCIYQVRNVQNGNFNFDISLSLFGSLRTFHTALCPRLKVGASNPKKCLGVLSRFDLIPYYYCFIDALHIVVLDLLSTKKSNISWQEHELQIF